MKRFMVVMCILAVGATAMAWEMRPERETIDWYDYLKSAREYFGINTLNATDNPIDKSDIRMLFLLTNIQAQYLEELGKWVSNYGPVSTLMELTQISGFGSPRAVFRVLMFWEFRDEGYFRDQGFFEEIKPDWWDIVPGPSGSGNGHTIPTDWNN